MVRKHTNEKNVFTETIIFIQSSSQEIFESFKLLTFNQLSLDAKLDVLTLFWLLFAFHYTARSTKGSLLNCTISRQ